MAEYDEEKEVGGVNMNKTISYDEDNDILSIHKGFSADEKFKGNVDVGELILDVSTQGRIRGIEVINATEFLKEFKIDKTILENISDANFSASIKPNRIVIGIVIKSKNIEIPAMIAVPLAVPTHF